MRYRRGFVFIASALLVAGSLAVSANAVAERRQRARPRPQQSETRITRRFATQHDAAARLVATVSNEHGRRAFETALGFAREHDLPVATVTRGGQPRILVNVPSEKIGAWTTAFSKGQCFIEPFFNNSHKSKPGWSMLRIGDKSFMEYGRGEAYRDETSSHRSAFPVALTQQEFNDTSRYVRDSPNGPWSYGGGSPPWDGQNCTNWVTHWIHPYTGVNTSAVVHHARQLFDNNRSGRLTVMGVMSSQLIEDFNADHGKASF